MAAQLRRWVARNKILTGTSDCYSSCPGLALSKPSLVPQPSSSRAEVIAPIRLVLWENAKNCDSCSIQETLTKLVSNEDRNSICLSWVLLFQDSLLNLSPSLRERGAGQVWHLQPAPQSESQRVQRSPPSSQTSGFQSFLKSIL